MTVLHSAPRFTAEEGLLDQLTAALGDHLIASREEYGETVLTVARDAIVPVLTTLRDQFAYQQLMDRNCRRKINHCQRAFLAGFPFIMYCDWICFCHCSHLGL